MKDFQLPIKYPRVSKSIRFPTTVIEQVEEEIRGTGLSFTEFVLASVRFSLDNLEEEQKDGEKSAL